MPTCSRCGAATIGGACLPCLRKRLNPSGVRQARDRARRKRPRQTVRSTLVDGVDLQPWLVHMAGLPVLGGRLVGNLPKLHIRRASKAPKRRLAFASYDRHLIHLTAWPELVHVQALETLLHEVVHLSSLDLRAHSLHFKQTLAQAAFECFDVDCRDAVGLPVYRLDRHIVDTLLRDERTFPRTPVS